MVAGLLAVLFLALLQVGFALHVRNTLTASAVDGARHGARADATAADGQQRAKSLIRSSLGERYARDVTVAEETVDGARVVVVTVRGSTPVLGPFGLPDSLDVSGRAYLEAQP